MKQIKQNVLDSLKKIPIKDIQNDIKGIVVKTLLLINKYKRKAGYMIPVAALVLVLAGYLAYQVFTQINHLNTQAELLIGLENYDITTLKLNEYTKKDVKNLRTITDMIEYKFGLNDEVQRYSEYLNSLQVPYTYFLQYIYLPRLNIRKNPYLWEIDINMIGINFLEKNPYNDIVLLQKRSDFFKYVGENNESNKITNISVGNIKEDENNYFTIPVTVTFVANSKRSFLLLVDKLSLTSNELNISLINEFVYYLWQQIKEQKQEAIQEVIMDTMAEYKEYDSIFTSNGETSQDKIIGYHFYKRIFFDTPNKLIDQEVLLATINKIISCENQKQEVCLYQFRDKYRSVPRLAYLFEAAYSADPVQNFHNFLKDIPPVLNIKSFTFDKMKGQQIVNNQNIKYEGKVTIDVYGKGILEEEITEIAEVLWKACFDKKIALTAEESINVIERTTANESVVASISALQGASLRELRDIMEDITKSYNHKSNYQKIITLFEIYRMMSDANLCEI